jgi:hypothetical protein
MEMSKHKKMKLLGKLKHLVFMHDSGRMNDESTLKAFLEAMRAFKGSLNEWGGRYRRGKYDLKPIVHVTGKQTRSDEPLGSLLRLAHQDYKEYLQTKHWNATRGMALKTKHYECERCRAKGIKLCVHHLRYDNVGMEPLEDLMVLCEKCHHVAHGITTSA